MPSLKTIQIPENATVVIYTNRDDVPVPVKKKAKLDTKGESKVIRPEFPNVRINATGKMTGRKEWIQNLCYGWGTHVEPQVKENAGQNALDLLYCMTSKAKGIFKSKGYACFSEYMLEVVLPVWMSRTGYFEFEFFSFEDGDHNPNRPCYIGGIDAVRRRRSTKSHHRGKKCGQGVISDIIHICGEVSRKKLVQYGKTAMPDLSHSTSYGYARNSTKFGEVTYDNSTDTLISNK